MTAPGGNSGRIEIVQALRGVAAAPGGNSGRIEIVQALRGVAAAAVLLYHGRWMISGGPWLNAGDRLFTTGAAGVDLFFLISGFIMVHVTAKASTLGDAATFLVKRWARIWPVYVVAMFLCFPIDPRGRGDDILWTSSGWLTIGKALVFYPTQPSAPPFFNYPPLNVGWSLVYEMWFYLLMALALLGGRRWPVVLGGLFVGTLVVLPLATTGTLSLSALHNYRYTTGFLNLITSPFIWEFALGILVGLAYRSRLRFKNLTLRVVALGLTGTAALFQLAGNVEGRHGLTGWGASIALFFFALMMANKERAFCPPRWLVWLGDISFSLYLYHFTIQKLGHFLRLNGHPEFGTGGAVFLASTSLTLLVAWLSYRYLEQGLAAWLRRRLLAVFAARA